MVLANGLVRAILTFNIDGNDVDEILLDYPFELTCDTQLDKWWLEVRTHTWGINDAEEIERQLTSSIDDKVLFYISPVSICSSSRPCYFGSLEKDYIARVS